MVYAASWWSADTFERFMTDSASPMWTNLRVGPSLVLSQADPIRFRNLSNPPH